MSMSDFFGGVVQGNIRFTDARIDGDGPLPTTLSGPEGINGNADGLYNFNDSLLSGITPYAYGQGRMGSDRNYQHIPHRKQFVIPPIHLPEPDPQTGETFEMSHSVDMGDIAFILNVQYKQFLLMSGPYKHIPETQDHVLPQYNLFCNICTVNYILAGLQNFIIFYATSPHMHSPPLHAWYRLVLCFGFRTELEHMKAKYTHEHIADAHNANVLLKIRCKILLQSVVQNKIIPMGICAMSEKQGGQHEIINKPVQAAASFYTTLTVDGQNRDLVNIWRGVELDAGDNLILQLRYVKHSQHPAKHNFVLNHYYKNTVTRTVSMDKQISHCLQLIPDVFRMFDHADTADRSWLDCSKFCQHMSLNIPEEDVRLLMLQIHDDRLSGYWQIGQTYTKKTKFCAHKTPINDMEMTKGQLLQINFAPVWKGTVYKNTNDDKVQFYTAGILSDIMFGDRKIKSRQDEKHHHSGVDVEYEMTRNIVASVTQNATMFKSSSVVGQNASKDKKTANDISSQAATSTIQRTTLSTAEGQTQDVTKVVQGAGKTENTVEEEWDFEKDIDKMFEVPMAKKSRAGK